MSSLQQFPVLCRRSTRASRNGHQSEDLSHLTFESDTFDVFVTSDVFEHVIDPANAFREIGRVLKPGGVHIFTMPWYPHQHTTVQRAGLTPRGDVEHYLEPVYHGNPIDAEGSLVTFDWGADFPQFIRRASGMETMVYLERDRSKGLDAELMEVFVSTKPCA
jgi:SAM-dependent methyltransferase